MIAYIFNFESQDTMTAATPIQGHGFPAFRILSFHYYTFALGQFIVRHPVFCYDLALSDWQGEKIAIQTTHGKASPLHIFYSS